MKSPTFADFDCVEFTVFARPASMFRYAEGGAAPTHVMRQALPHSIRRPPAHKKEKLLTNLAESPLMTEHDGPAWHYGQARDPVGAGVVVVH